jgi:hypothetical protein
MIAKEAEYKDNKPAPHFQPYLQNISLLLDDKAMSSDQVWSHPFLLLGLCYFLSFYIINL